MTDANMNIPGGRRAFPWELAAAAAVLASGAAAGLYLMLRGLPQRFPELISGEIAWRGGFKPADLALLFGFAGFFALSFAVLSSSDRVLQRSAGDLASRAFRTSLTYACLPACFVLAAVVAIRRFDFAPFGISALVVAAIGGLAGLTAWRANRPAVATVAPTFLSAAPLAAFFAALAPPMLILAASRLVPAWRPGPALIPWTSFLSAAVVLLAAGGLVLSARPGLGRLLRRLLILVQAPLALGYLACIPTPWVAGGKPIPGYPYGPALWTLILALVGLALFDVLRRWPRTGRAEEGGAGLVSPLALAALMVLLRFPTIGLAGVPPDDYHFGEHLLPWWGWWEHGLVPFRDYDPVRGLVSLLDQLFSGLFFDGTAATMNAALAIEYALFASAWLWALSRFVPVGLAFAVLLFFVPVSDYFAIQSVSSILLFSVCAAFAARRYAWCALAWLAAAPAMVLFATGDGGLVLLALAPLAAISAWSCLREPDLKRNLALAGGVLLLWGLILLVTPLGATLYGSVRYAVENAGVNAVANGIPWSGLARTPGFASSWFLELARNEYLLVLAALLVIVWTAWPAGRRDENARRQVIFASTAGLFILLYILRVAVRIDPGNPSRLGFLSVWALVLGLPPLYLAAGRQRRGVLALAAVFATGLVACYWFWPQSLFLAVKDGPAARVVVTQPMTDGGTIGLPHLGRGVMDAAHLKHITSLKPILDGLLTADETYLDLTNRNAHYFYFDRPPPIASGAFYNLPAEAQQRRALTRLAENPPPAVLIDADNITHDGGPASLRCHLLYRRFALAYVPVRLGRFGFLLRPDRYRDLAEGRLRLPAADAFMPPARDSETELGILDAAFKRPVLENLPQNWGRSWASLAGGLTKVADLAVAKAGLHALRRVKDGRFEIIGHDPYLTIPVAGLGLSGARAGLLVLDFDSDAPAGRPVTLQVFFGADGVPLGAQTAMNLTATGGRLIVPLDAFPRWLTARRIDTVRIDVADPAPCRLFRLTNVALYQRSSAGAAK